MPSKPRENGPKRLVGLIIGVALVLFGGWIIYRAVTTNSENTVFFNRDKVVVEIASSTEQQIKGLSGRASLDENAGMLFVYEQPGQYTFWMKDMNFPIDIIWLDSDKTVIDITKNLSPATYPETFTSTTPSQYILEVNAGYSEEHSIDIGEKAVFKLYN